MEMHQSAVQIFMCVCIHMKLIKQFFCEACLARWTTQLCCMPVYECWNRFTFSYY